MAQLVKNLPAMWETWVWSLGRENPLEKGKATHSSILAWRIPWTTVQGIAKSWTPLRDFHFHVRRALCAWVFSHVWLSVTPWTAAHQAPLSIAFFQARTLDVGFSRPGNWTRVPCVSCIVKQILYTTEPPGKPGYVHKGIYWCIACLQKNGNITFPIIE